MPLIFGAGDPARAAQKDSDARVAIKYSKARKTKQGEQDAGLAATAAGSPNNINFIDSVGSTLRGQYTSMTCWIDNYTAYSLNEVAINWNASLA